MTGQEIVELFKAEGMRIELGTTFSVRGQVAQLISGVRKISRDTERLDWLADPANHIGNVQLPTECVERNITSMRDAIDEAMGTQA
jgi:hypothetical protein